MQPASPALSRKLYQAPAELRGLCWWPPPVLPSSFRVRVALSATHTEAQGRDRVQ